MTMRLDGNTDFFGKFSKEIEREIYTAFSDSVDVMQANVRKNIVDTKAVDQGHLLGSIQKSIVISGNRGLGIVGSNSAYVLPLELGIQKRFYPSDDMIKQLRRWAVRKLGLSGKEAFKAGAAIAWKIARKGLDSRRFPAKFFEKAQGQSAPQIAKIFSQHVERAARLSVGRSNT